MRSTAASNPNEILHHRVTSTQRKARKSENEDAFAIQAVGDSMLRPLSSLERVGDLRCGGGDRKKGRMPN